VTTSTRAVLSVLALALAYALLMSGLVGTPEFLALVVVLAGALFLIWRGRDSYSSH
jgi:threonine/homoserine/homoserine lactone efflux protein